MAKQDFLPRAEGQLDEWENNFLMKLITYGPTLTIDPTVITNMNSAVTAHRNAFANALMKQNEAKAADQDKMAKKAIAFEQIRDVARKCKASTAYTEAIGAELGITGSERTLDLANAKPEVSRITQLVDQIVFDWVKGGMDGIVVYGAKRTAESTDVINLQRAATGIGTGASDDAAGLIINPPTPPNLVWEEIGRDYRSPYEDKRRNLGNKPEVRFYKFHYLYKDELVGVDSDIIKVIAEIY